mgnify:CR=1 FL=1
MRIVEIVSPYTSDEELLNKLYAADTNKIQSVYQQILVASASFSISAIDTFQPDIIDEIVEQINELNSAILPIKSQQMIQEIRQWLNGD